MAKRILSVLLVLVLCLTSFSVSYAHEREEHDEDIEYVLFGNRDYKKTHPTDSKRIHAIEDAVFLCVDQFNGSGEKELDNLLNKEKVPGIIQSIDEINYKSNYSHRSLTHRGWNVTYEEKAHWPLRQQILRNTVRKELFSSLDTPISWFPWLSEKIYGKNNYEKQLESFCILLYCVHVLGDHIEAGEEKDLGQGESRAKTLQEKTTGLAYILPLAHTEDRDNPGLIPDLIKNCETLFASQSETYTYRSFIQELEELRDRSEGIYESKGGVNTDEKFEDYNACAKELLDVLGAYVPGLLKKEKFFSNTFH